MIVGNRGHAKPVLEVDFAHNGADAIMRLAIERVGYGEGNLTDLRDATLGTGCHRPSWA